MKKVYKKIHKKFIENGFIGGFKNATCKFLLCYDLHNS